MPFIVYYIYLRQDAIPIDIKKDIINIMYSPTDLFIFFIHFTSSVNIQNIYVDKTPNKIL